MSIITKSDYEYIKSHIDKLDQFSLQKEQSYPKIRIEPSRYNGDIGDKIKDGDYYVGINVETTKTSGFGMPIAQHEFNVVFGTYEIFCSWLEKRGIEFENPEHVLFLDQISMF